MSTDEFARYDAAYVMGALSPTDRRDFEAHLKGCAACAGAVGELAGLPGLMSRVSLEQLDAEVEAPPETLLASMARVARRERGRRRLVVSASTVAVAALIAVGAVALGRPDWPYRPPVAGTPTTTVAPGTADLALHPVVPSPVTASVRLLDMAWGTRVDLSCTYDGGEKYPAEGLPYALVVTDRFGGAQQVGTWMALPGRRLTVVGASALARPDIATVEIRTMSGRAILRLTT